MLLLTFIRPIPVRRVARFVLVALIVIGLLGTTSPISAEDQAAPLPDAGSVRFDLAVASTTLYGRDIALTLHAENPSGVDGYNLSFTAALPPGVAYVGASSAVSGEAASEPVQRHQDDGSTVLVWTNLSDLLAGASSSLSLRVRPDTAIYDVGDSLGFDAAAYLHDDARTIPDFDLVTGDATGDITSHGVDVATTQLSPFDVRLREPNAESELLRGVHDHQTIFTVTLENNLVNPSTGFAIETHLPAGLDFLGCGGVDNSGEGLVEYPGAPRLDVIAPSLTDPCLEPSSVETLSVDPDGDGPLTDGVHTKVVWDESTLAAEFGSADLAEGESIRFSYVAAASMRSNLAVSDINAIARLDDNGGPLTFDEQSLISHARATGDYNDVDPAAAEGTELVVAEDVSVHTSVSTGAINQGGNATWTLLIESSEYATATGPIVVTETVPDGLDVTGSTHSFDQGFPQTNADGTITLRWTVAGFDAPNRITSLAYDTVARSAYRASGLPVMTKDAWSSTTALATTADVITDSDGATTNLAIVDASGAGQRAAGIAIAKSVAAPDAADGSCGDGTGLAFDSNLAGPFRPGDRVCWRITVDFPAELDTRRVLVRDHLPAGFVYEGHSPTTQDTVGGPIDVAETGSLLEWDLGDVDAGGQHVDLVVQTRIVDPEAAEPADITANLLKVRHSNTAGTVFQHRDDANASWAEATIDLEFGVADVNGSDVANAPADQVAVKGGDVVTMMVRVDNTAGTAPAHDVSVRSHLPDGISCSDVSAISDGGFCSTDDGWIDWTAPPNLDLAAGATHDLLYDIAVPAGITAGVSLPSVAGVRTYYGETNTGVAFEYVPAANIDPALTPNTDAADDPSSITTPWPTLDKTRTTAIIENGNGSSEATIGEAIDYSISVTLPAGTTYYGPAVISDELGTRLSLDAASVDVTLDGGALPADWVVTTADNRIRVIFGDDHTVPTGADQLVEVDFGATVTDVGSNTRGRNVRNTVKLEWDDHLGRSKSRSDAVNTRIVEPNLAISKASDDADGVLDPAQVVNYTVTVANPAVSRVSAAYDVVVMDTVPAELTVLAVGGAPAQTGDLVGPDAGVYNEANQTITWLIDSIARGGSVSLDYDAQVADPLVASTVVANAATATATSIPGDGDGERTPYSGNGGLGSGYRVDTVHGMFAPSITLTKTPSVTEATVGDTVDHTIAVTVPADTIAHDIVVMDDLPLGLDFETLLNVSCTSGAQACEPDLSAVSVLDGGHDVAFFVGDAASPASEDRVVTITYRTHVRNHHSVSAGDVVPNAAYVRHNAVDRVAGVLGGYPWTSVFDHTSDSVTATVTVIEPELSIDKTVDGQGGDTDFRRAVPGETLSYTLVIRNGTGTSISAAHDLVVTDAIDDRLLDFLDTTTAVGAEPVDADLTDGTLSWVVDGPLAPGASVTISYDVTIPADWDHT
ncbi:MAG: isopeptide-forming domain-containing fimbrial protein, partial [Actinomycetota bacterium]